MINLVAIDDEQPPLKIIERYSEQVKEIISVKTFNNLHLAKLYIESNKIEVLIIDIEMPEQNGLTFYANLSYKPLLIIATAYEQYALKGYEISAIDYLLKPFALEKFYAAIIKAATIIAGQNINDVQEIIKLKSNYSILQINVNSIIYIESFADYVDIHCTDGTKQNARTTMKELLLKLGNKKFIRVHRSYIVSSSKIDSYRNGILKINNASIPVGRSYRNAVMKALQ